MAANIFFSAQEKTTKAETNPVTQNNLHAGFSHTGISSGFSHIGISPGFSHCQNLLEYAEKIKTCNRYGLMGNCKILQTQMKMMDLACTHQVAHYIVNNFSDQLVQIEKEIKKTKK